MKGREFKRVWGEAWDYGYLLAIEQRKLRDMVKYFDKHRNHLDVDVCIRDIRTCIKLIDIVLEKDNEYLGYLHTKYGLKENIRYSHYVNTKNYRRFVRELPTMDNSPQWLSGTLHDSWIINLRQHKALYLYNKIRSYKLLTWWD